MASLLGSWVTAGANTEDHSHTAEAGADRILVVVVHGQDGASRAVTGITYGGEALTKLDDATAAQGASFRIIEIWYLLESGIAAASGSTVDVTWDTQPANYSSQSGFYGDVDQTNPWGDPERSATGGGTSDPITTAALGTGNGDMVVAGYTGDGSGTQSVTWNNGFSERTDYDFRGTAAGEVGSVAHKAADGSDETPSVSYDGTLEGANIVAGVLLAADTDTPTTPNAPTETTGANGEMPTSEYDVLAGPDQGSYKWVADVNGTNSYHLEAAAGGDPGLTEVVPALSVYMDGTILSEGTLGSLTDHQVAWGDNESLGYETLHLRDDSGDPDTTGVEILYMRATEYIEVTGIDDTLGNDLRIEYQITDHDTWGFSKTEAITGTTMTVKLEDLPADRGIDARPITVNTDEDPDVESDPGGTLTFRSAPEPPSQVTAVEGTPDDEVDISWQSNSGSAYSHRVWETLVADPARTVGTQPGGTNSITDDGGGSGLDPGTYQYTVRSYNATDDKWSGPVVSGTVQIGTAVTLTVQDMAVATSMESPSLIPGGTPIPSQIVGVPHHPRAIGVPDRPRIVAAPERDRVIGVLA